MLRRFLDCLEKGRNKEAKSVFPELKNRSEWIDSTGSTFLHHSAYHGNAEMTQYLIDKGCKVNVRDRNGISPLMLAVESSDVKTVKVFLKNNVDIYVDHNKESSILAVAAYLCIASLGSPSKPNIEQISKMLFDKVNKDFSEGKLTLPFLKSASDLVKFVIVVFGNADIVKFLLKNCYTIDFHEPGDGLTALHCTIYLARFENAKILIEHGANINALDKKGNSPLNFYPNSFDDVDKDSEILKIFLRNSTRLSASGPHKLTELEYLLTRGKRKTVKTVLQSGMDLEKYFVVGTSLLSLLVINDDIGVLDLLVELDIKFDVNERSINGFTPLMVAAHVGCLRRMTFLLEHKADVNLTLPTGESVLCYALADHPKGYSKKDSDVVEMVELLLQHGTDIHIFFKHEATVVNMYPIVGLKIILAHLAILETSKQPSSTSLPNIGIKLKQRYKDHFDSCVRQLEKMKNIEINGTVTLFELLTDSDEKIITYAGNEKLMSALNSALEKFSHMESYYISTLLKKVTRAIDLVKLQAKVGSVIQAFTVISTNE